MQITDEDFGLQKSNMVTMDDDIIGETSDDDIPCTADDDVADKVESSIEIQTKKKKLVEIKIQRNHILRICQWLIPYIVTTIAVVIIGSMIMLVTHIKADRLYSEIQEQYGEYFTDEW